MISDLIKRTDAWLVLGLVSLVRLYRLTLSPWVGQQCRFYPTCSSYAITAIQTHGPWRGLRLIIGRLLRCHPFHAGGVDEVPVLASTKCDATNPAKAGTHMIGDL